MKYVIDECLDSYGHCVIREDDGSPDGDITRPPIATVYDDAMADKIVRLLNQEDRRFGNGQ